MGEKGPIRKKMIIAIDLTSLSYHLSGIERYAMGISEEMVKYDQENEYVLIFRNSILPSFLELIDEKRIRSYVIYGNKKLLFLQIVLPYYLYKIKADKYIFLAYPSPIIFFHKDLINTIHDMGAWDADFALSVFQKIYWKISYYLAAKKSNKLVTVSEFSRNRICLLLKYNPRNVHIAYPGIADTFKRQISNIEINNNYNLPEKYILSLSTVEPRKNIKLLLTAYSSIQDKVSYDLVLVGRFGWDFENDISSFYLNNRIHFTGFVDDELLPIIYKNSLCFVFPTLYEGFGLPPVEALACKTPVISSDAASMPEVLRGQAIFFRSNDEQELSKLLLNIEKSVSSMPHQLDEFQLNNYRFDESARKILRILDELK